MAQESWSWDSKPGLEDLQPMFFLHTLISFSWTLGTLYRQKSVSEEQWASKSCMIFEKLARINKIVCPWRQFFGGGGGGNHPWILPRNSGADDSCSIHFKTRTLSKWNFSREGVISHGLLLSPCPSSAAPRLAWQSRPFTDAETSQVLSLAEWLLDK